MLSTSDYVLIGLKDGTNPEELLGQLGNIRLANKRILIRPPKIVTASDALFDGQSWNEHFGIWYTCLDIFLIAPQHLFSPDTIKEYSDELNIRHDYSSIAVNLLIHLLKDPSLAHIVSTFERGSRGVVRIEPRGEEDLLTSADSCSKLFNNSHVALANPDMCPRWNLKAIYGGGLIGDSAVADTLPESLQPAKLAERVDIAVLDSGIDRDHRQLHHVAPGIRIGSGSHLPMNMPVDFDLLGHGSSVAGIINALKVPDSPLEGIAGACTLVPISVLKPAAGVTCEYEAFEYEILGGLEYCCKNRISICNLSIGDVQGFGSDYNKIIEHAAQRYGQKSNGILIAASGDRSGGTLSTWAKCPSVICVGAIECEGPPQCDYLVSPESSYCIDIPEDQSVELCAPGKPLCVVNAMQTGPYKLLAGTSFACPHVAAAAGALAGKMFAHRQVLDLAGFRAVIRETCTPVSGIANSDRQEETRAASGFGLLNIYAMLRPYI
jgi:hypothetical protein